MKIHIVAAALPPQIDGIGDYTAHLAVALAQAAQIEIWTALEPVPTPLAGVDIKGVFAPTRPRSVRRLELHAAAVQPDWLLLQYNPFSYGRWGFNLDLPLVVRQIRQRQPGLRFAVMVHEPFVRVQNWKFALMALWQRWQLWALGRSAEVIFASIELWTRELQRWFPGKAVVHLPVGSNVERYPIANAAARSRLHIPRETVTIGLFGSVHPGYRLPWVYATAQAVMQSGSPVQVIYIGPDQQAVRSALDAVPVIGDARVPAAEVSRRLSAVDIYLAPFVDGVSTRRTSWIAALQHGLACVGTIGHNTGAMLLDQDEQAYLLAPVANADAFQRQLRRLLYDRGLRDRLGAAAEEFYRSQFTWEVIASRVLTALGASQ